MTSLFDSVKSRLKEDDINFVLVQFVDLKGAAKVKMCPAEELDTLAAEGAGFAGAAIGGFAQGPNSPDMMARIDLNTYTPLHWRPGMARFAADLYVEGEAYPYCPRTNLRRVLNDAAGKFGFTLNVGLEPEHFLVSRKPNGSIAPWDPGEFDRLPKPCYDFKGISPAFDYLQEIVGYCNRLEWGAYQADHEDANGQYEVNFKYADALTTADRYTFFKMMTSQVAPKYGAIASHMAKPYPYLVFAAYLAAGLDGIQEDKDPGEPNHENLYELTPVAIRKRGMKTLPQSLLEALHELERDPVVLHALGPISDEFLALKRKEWADYHRSVSGWELENYLTLF